MAEHSRFFDGSVENPIYYTAGEWREYFSLFYKNGVNVTDNTIDLQVTAGGEMSVNVAVGYGFILGGLYHNDTILNLSIDASDATLDRIDRVVLRFDEVNKEITTKIKKGTLASSPIAPILSDASTLKELSLARVRIRKGATSILTSDITDERVTEFCGVISPVFNVPIADMWDNWEDAKALINQDWLDRKNAINGEWTVDKNSINSEWDNLKMTYQDWLALIQADLGARVITSPLDANISLMNEGDVWIKWK